MEEEQQQPVDVVTLSIDPKSPDRLRVRGKGSPETVLAWLAQAAEIVRMEWALTSAVAHMEAKNAQPGRTESGLVLPGG